MVRTQPEGRSASLEAFRTMPETAVSIGDDRLP
jgi:hypothetical protein